ncbi:DUF5723 family protein [uncultured Draconibacterium sp.]|uniref:DUF5723 family protein n=1 Tax=uncultured Draconibacterium sp. TaxID=1573823 RepID=UPI002AA90119|nr:DUF5723 family protein [uncultured Draconibacterium sp.]
MKNFLGKIKFYVLLFAVLGWFSAEAQNGNPLQFLSEVSQSSLANPAFQNQSEKLIIGLPVLSGASLKWNANFSPDYIFSENFSYSFDRFYNSLGEPGEAAAIATLPIIYLSLKSNKQTFGLSLSERILVSGNFDHEFLRFIDQGLVPYYGQEEEYGPISLKTHLFKELAFSYARQVNKKLSLGIRTKVLFGQFFYDIENMNLTVQTDEAKQLLQIIPSGTYRVSGPIDVQYHPLENKTTVKPDLSAGDYFFKFKNMGAGIDLGFSYALSKQTSISVAIADLGFTSLKYRSYDNTFSGSIDYHINDLYQSTDPGSSTYFEPKEALLALSDSLPYITSAEAFTQRQYELLPIKLNLMATHRLNDRMKLNFSDNLTYYNGESNNYLSAYFNILLGTRFELSSGLNLYNAEQLLPGFACSYTGKSVQVFLATNNIYKLVQPSKAKNLNLCFGVNLLFSTQPKLY